MKKITKIKILRTIVQVLFFIFFPALISLAFFQVKTLGIDIINSNYSQIVSDCIVIIMLSILTIFAGRIFCGWMCIFGAYNDWVYIISSKVFKVKYKVNQDLDEILKYIKYIVLTVIVLFIWTGIITLPAGSSPWDAYTQIFDIKYLFQEYLIGTILLIAITIGAIFIERFFCRYLCPLGAIFSILSKCKIFKINKEKTACGPCKACTVKCSMGINLDQMEKVNSGECIQCLNCVGICPKSNARMKFLDYDINEKSFFAIVISFFIGIYTFANSTLQNNSNNQNLTDLTNNIETQSVNSNNITTDSTNSTTTNGIKSNTTNSATSNSTKSNTTNSTTTNSIKNNTTNSTKTNSTKSNTTNSTTTNSTNSNTTNSGVTNSTTNSTASSTNSNTSKYKDGTYTGTGRGYRDGLTVSVTIKDGKITNIEILSINDTPGYYERATNVVPKEIINAQSTQVNTVSGATRSSNGIISAVNNALALALN